MKDFKRIIASALVMLMVVGCVACGASKDPSIGDSAFRTQTEDEAVYFDDEAIALADGVVEGDNAAAAARSAFDQVNAKRAASGLSQLTWNENLVSCARVRAQELVQAFSHTRPNGQDWYTVNSNIMYGENLAQAYNSADSVVAAWMASPTHAANIMDAGFKSIGIAVFQNSDGTWYWAQEFGY